MPKTANPRRKKNTQAQTPPRVNRVPQVMTEMSPEGVGLRDDSVDSQAGTLQMLNTKQRQQAMSQIGRVQGNGHVQRLVDVLQWQEGAETTDEPLNTLGLGVDDKELTGHADQGGRFRVQRAPGDGTAAAPPAPTTTANINL